MSNNKINKNKSELDKTDRRKNPKEKKTKETHTDIEIYTCLCTQESQRMCFKDEKPEFEEIEDHVFLSQVSIQKPKIKFKSFYLKN